MALHKVTCHLLLERLTAAHIINRLACQCCTHNLPLQYVDSCTPPVLAETLQ